MINNGNPCAMVTGAGRRIGRELALALAKEGFDILLHYHSSNYNVSNVIREIQALGARVYKVKADLADPKEIDAIFEFIDLEHLAMKILINSAATMIRRKLSDTTLEEWDATINLNLRAPFLISQKMAARMKDGGTIINISDIAKDKLWTNYGAYCLSKDGVWKLTRLMAKLYAPNIRVNAIAPGLVLRSEDISENDWENLIIKMPLKKNPSPDDISKAVIFLIQNESITGQVITVDGGYSLI